VEACFFRLSINDLGSVENCGKNLEVLTFLYELRETVCLTKQYFGVRKLNIRSCRRYRMVLIMGFLRRGVMAPEYS